MAVLPGLGPLFELGLPVFRGGQKRARAYRRRTPSLDRMPSIKYLCILWNVDANNNFFSVDGTAKRTRCCKLYSRAC
jgi:hypothetical protein